jgi:hypothetical protein
VPERVLVGARRDLERAVTSCSAKAHVAHAPLDGAARDQDVLAAELAPDLVRTVHGVVVVPHALDVRTQLLVALRAHGLPVRILGARTMPVVRRRGNRQHIADWLDPVHGTMLVDEGHHHFGRRSSSAWAKYADALRGISFARFSSRFSRSISSRRSRSFVARPGRFPESRSACRTHRRSASDEQPIFSAMDTMAAYRDSCASCCSNTSRTARSRISGGNFL